MKVQVKQRTLENVFFVTEVFFLLMTSAIALYNIFYDKNMIPLLVVLGGYILSIKALRRIFLEVEKTQDSKSKWITFTYLVASTYIIIQLSIVLL